MSQNADRPTQLLVLDPRLEGWPALLAAAGPGVAVLVLDPARDGLAQVAEVAEELAPLSAIHVAGSGAPGHLRLGSIVLDAESLAGRAAELSHLGGAIAPGGVLLLRDHGAATSAAGGRFVAALSRALARDVEAAGGRAAARPLHILALPVAAAPFRRPRLPVPASQHSPG